jgi:hypothetical protein
MATLTKVKSFLSAWQNLLALGTLIPLGIWIFSRVWMVNPAILGDEYLYSMNSRKAAPWDPSPAGDFSNYLFNFVYQGTNLCGQAFYSCAKVFNILFFLGFIFTLFLVAIRFLSFWAAYGFMIAAALSPLSVYTSMFLPESMYMFFIGLLLIAVLHAMNNYTWQSWALVGSVIGVASLVKPHAWLSAIAVGITMLVVGLGNRQSGIKKASFAVGAFVAGSALSRIVIGLVVAGPKALSFFGQYFGLSTVEQVISGAGLSEVEAESGLSPMSGVFDLFGAQTYVHALVISALMAISVVALSVGVIDIVKQKQLKPVTSFGLFAFIWLFSLMLEIVIFTGWVTGTGDDHTSRVLLRYYEFLFVIVPLAGLSILGSGVGQRANVWVRWSLSAVFAALLTPAFTGFFASLTIQIADAPTLAGLVVNADIFNGVAIVGMASLILFASFPRYSPLIYAALLPLTMIGTGWNIQHQYQQFRGNFSAADIAGIYLRDTLNEREIDQTYILATSRFDATNIAIWADSPGIQYQLVASGSQFPLELVPEGTMYVISTSDIQLQGQVAEEYVGDGFVFYNLTR